MTVENTVTDSWRYYTFIPVVTPYSCVLCLSYRVIVVVVVIVDLGNITLLVRDISPFKALLCLHWRYYTFVLRFITLLCV